MNDSDMLRLELSKIASKCIDLIEKLDKAQEPEDGKTYNLPDLLPQVVGTMELEFVEKHYADLYERFPDQWIAVVGHGVIAHHISAIALHIEVSERGIRSPYIVQMKKVDEEPTA